MVLLLLRIGAAPVLILAGSLAQQRFGHAIGGRLVGLPLTSLPLLALFAAAHGATYAASAATATLAGVVGQSAWALSYALAARRHGPVRSAAVATAAFGAVCLLLYGADLSLIPAAVLATVSVAGALAVWPATSASPHPGGEASRGELYGRMAAGSAFTVAVTGASGSLQPQAAGLFGSYPVLTVVLAVVTRRRGGVGAATVFLEGVVAGTLSVVAALVAVAATLSVLGPIGAFPLAVGVAVAAQLVPVGWARRSRPGAGHISALQASSDPGLTGPTFADRTPTGQTPAV